MGKREPSEEPRPVLWSGRPSPFMYLVSTLRRTLRPRSNFRILLKYHDPKRVPADASQTRLRYPMPSLTVMRTFHLYKCSIYT
jgi:hypothetical protein